MSSIDPINPTALGSPRGYSNGMRVPAGRALVFVAGQIAWDEAQNIVGEGDFAEQMGQALRNVAAVVAEAGGEPQDICSMTLYVTDKQAYLGSTTEIGGHWRQIMGRHYPAMALVEVAALVEDAALVEIQAVAAIRVEEEA